MKTLRFEGHSDDTFGEYAETNDDYDNCASGKPIRWRVHSESTGGGLLVYGQHCPEPAMTWGVGVAKLDEDQVVDWPVRMRFDGYKTAMEIDVPDDATVTCVERDDED